MSPWNRVIALAGCCIAALAFVTIIRAQQPGGSSPAPQVDAEVLKSVVYALDALTGKEIWRWDPEVNQPAVRPKICCGIVNRGLALYNGMIFAPIIDGRLEALNALTGKVIWESRVAYTQNYYSITMAPRIANGKVLIG